MQGLICPLAYSWKLDSLTPQPLRGMVFQSFCASNTGEFLALQAHFLSLRGSFWGTLIGPHSAILPAIFIIQQSGCIWNNMLPPLGGRRESFQALKMVLLASTTPSQFLQVFLQVYFHYQTSSTLMELPVCQCIG